MYHFTAVAKLRRLRCWRVIWWQWPLASRVAMNLIPLLWVWNFFAKSTKWCRFFGISVAISPLQLSPGRAHAKFAVPASWLEPYPRESCQSDRFFMVLWFFWKSQRVALWSLWHQRSTWNRPVLSGTLFCMYLHQCFTNFRCDELGESCQQSFWPKQLDFAGLCI